MPQISSSIGNKIASDVAKIIFSHWDSWNAKEYLNTYFSKLGQDSLESLKFIVDELKKLKPKTKISILDFGAGPTIFTGIAAAPYASTIHLCDYLESNLIEIRKWILSEEDSFDWSHCIKHILQLEGNPHDQKAIAERSLLLKKKTGNIFRSDASLNWPLYSNNTNRYSIVISNFCADSATSSKEVWRAYMINILNLVEYGGQVIINALHNCKYYKSGNKIFPSANVNEQDLKDILVQNGFDKRNLILEVRLVPDCAKEGFTSIMCASATKLSKKEHDIIKTYKQVTIEHINNA